MRAAAHALVLLGSLLGATLLALVAGAPDLGTALSFGQIAFVVALMLVLVAS